MCPRASICPVKLATVLDIGADPTDEPDLSIRKTDRGRRGAWRSWRSPSSSGSPISRAGATGLAVLALVQIVAFGAALLVFRRTHRLAHLIATMAIVGLAVLFLSLIPSGGLSWGAARPRLDHPRPARRRALPGRASRSAGTGRRGRGRRGGRRHRPIHPISAARTIARRGSCWRRDQPHRPGRHRARPRGLHRRRASSVPRRSPTPCCSMSCPARSPIDSSAANGSSPTTTTR